MRLSKDAKKKMKLWSEAVKERDGHRCRLCGSTTKLNAHHIISRNYPGARFDVNNGITLCPKCHNFGHMSAHKNPVFFATWLLLNAPDLFQSVLKHSAAILQKENKA